MSHHSAFVKRRLWWWSTIYSSISQSIYSRAPITRRNNHCTAVIGMNVPGAITCMASVYVGSSASSHSTCTNCMLISVGEMHVLIGEYPPRNIIVHFIERITSHGWYALAGNKHMHAVM